MDDHIARTAKLRSTGEIIAVGPRAMNHDEDTVERFHCVLPPQSPGHSHRRQVIRRVRFQYVDSQGNVQGQ